MIALAQHTATFAIWFGYVFFVVYGSLVPLDFKPLPLDQAWAVFQNIPMYKLGVESRADWISNGVLYVPVGFLTTHLLIQRFSDTWRFSLLFLGALFSFGLAFGVEFTQLFFPPRTVSQNDIFAEIVGSLIGLILAARYSDWFKALLHAVLGKPGWLALRLLEAYLVAYVTFSLFPFDILLSRGELEQKILGGGWGFLLADDGQGKVLVALKLIAEVILTLPFGLFLGYRAVRPSATLKQAAWWGLGLGCFIEIAQFFTASGVSQGLSILTRILGVYFGMVLWSHRASWSPERVTTLVNRHAIPVVAIYFLALLHVNGWFTHEWNGADFAVSQFAKIHFLPFYYHYFTTEAKALFSLLSVCLMYLPIGLLTWSQRGSPSLAFFYALCAAGLVETSKLFLQGLHADPTNIILGALASWAAVHLARVIFDVALVRSMYLLNETTVPRVQQSQRIVQHRAQHDKSTFIARSAARHLAPYVVLLPSLAFAAYWAATFPTQPALLCVFLAVCAAIVWVRPALFVVIILAALPVLDLAPWSGRFFLDEFDLLVLVSLVIGYVRIPLIPSGKQRADIFFALACSIVGISYSVGVMHGLLPWQTPDANAFTNYYSPFNALRIAKGVLWAFLSYRLLRRLVVDGVDVQRLFTWGLVTGLFLTVGVVFWERIAFSGLFNFTSDYRITGPFSAMHIGGAYIECFLVIATPFLMGAVLKAKSWMAKICGTTLLLASTYSLMVTFSRNGYFAFGVSLVVIAYFAIVSSGRWLQRSIVVAVLSGAMMAVALPIFNGEFAQNRIATVLKDYTGRQAHWEDALQMRTNDHFTTLFGMGLGRYPESHYLLSQEGGRSGTYQLGSENGNTFLRLVSGSSIYVEQFVSVIPQQKYLLKLDVRANRVDATITIPICEKWLLASYNCVWSSLVIGKESGVWHHFEVQFSSDQLSISRWFSARPIKFSLYNGNANAIIDVDNVRLEAIRGDNLLYNGDFSNEFDHWFFSADSHLQWHTKSLPISVLFDQGWFGFFSILMFSMLAIKRAASRARRGDLYASAALAAFCGFLVIGLFDTLIDAPRFLFLFLLIGWFCGFRSFDEFIMRRNNEMTPVIENTFRRKSHA